MKRMNAIMWAGVLSLTGATVWAQSPSSTEAQRAAQEEIVRRQEAVIAARILIDQGQQLYRAGNYDQAVLKLQEALKIIPRSSMTEPDVKRATTLLDSARARMGTAPRLTGGPSPDEPRLDETPEFEAKKAQIKKLFREGNILLNSGQLDEAEKRFKQVLAIDRYNEDAFALLGKVNEVRQDIALSGSQAVRKQRMWEVTDAWVPPVQRELIEMGKGPSQAVSTTSAKQAELLQKLNEIIVPEINFRDAVIADVVNFLSQESRRLDPKRVGVNFLLGAGVGGETAAPPPAPLEGAPVVTETGARRITLQLTTIPLIDALKYVTDLAGLKYRVESSAVLILPLEAAVEGMVNRNYPVNAGAIKTVLATPGVASAMGGAGTDTYRAFGTGTTTTMTPGGDVKALFTEAGVPFPPGSSIVYNERTSMLIVRNTPENLEIFERVLAAFNVVPSQVEIEAKFVDVQQSDLDELGFDWTIGSWQFGHFNDAVGQKEFLLDGMQSTMRDVNSAKITANALDALLAGTGASTIPNTLGSITGVLTDPAVQVVIKALSQKTSTDLLSAPKVTTISGQQAQIRVVQEFIYPSRYREAQVTSSGGNGSSSSAIVGSIPEEFKTREVGVLLNVTPTASPDGNTINLTLVPEVSEFLGFLDYSSFGQITGGNLITNTIKQPLFQSRNLTTSVVIWDGQTVVLGGLLREDTKQINDKVPFLGDIPWLGRLFQSRATQRTKRNLLIFVTARLVDPAGNPIHRSGLRPGL